MTIISIQTINKLQHSLHALCHIICRIEWTTDGKTFSVLHYLFAFLNEVSKV